MRKTHLLAALAAALVACKSGPAAAPAAPTTEPTTPPAAAAPAAQPAATTAAPAPVRTIEGITEYVLPNGLRVLLFPDASKDTVTVNITYLVGSRHEGYGETGMAHLLEHMMFKGSTNHPKVWAELEERGAANNASTDYDRTNYFETLPAKGDSLEWALGMEADRMVNSFIAQKDLDSEFSVVRNEFEMYENRPDAILFERILSTAYLWHNYGKSVIGSRSDIERVPATRLQAFYRKYYRPDNAVLVVAGKFETGDALARIAAAFGPIARPQTPLEATWTVEPVQDGERLVTLRRVGDVNLVGVAYHVIAGSDPDFPAVEAIADALTAEPSGRLYQALVKTGMATGVDAFDQAMHDPGVLLLTAKVRADKPWEPVRDKMIAIVEGLARNPVTDEEVARFRAKSKKQFRLRFANSEWAALDMTEWAALGDWRLLFLHRDRVEALTPAEVTRVAGKFLVPSNRTLGLFLPTKQPLRAPLVEAPAVEPMVEGYKGRPAIAEGEKFEASVANIEKRTRRASFTSGLKLAVLEKRTRGNAVRARLTVRFGSEKDFRGKRLALAFLGDMIERGTRKHTFQQMKDEWDRLEAQVRVSSSASGLEVSITTTHDNLPDVLALVDEMLRQATFPADQFEISRKEYLTSLEQARSDPQAKATRAFQRTVAPYPPAHPFYTPTVDEEIAAAKALKLGEIKALYRWLGMSDATLTIVGDFDPALVEPWVERTWGGWKSPRRYERVERPYIATEPGEQLIDTPDKEMAFIVAGYAVKMRDDDPDYPAMTVANYVLGGGGFVSRLLQRLREKEGFSYGAGSMFRASPLDDFGLLLAIALVSPQNAERGMAAMLEEMERLVKGGVAGDELAKAKEALGLEWKRNLANDGFVLGLLHEGLFVGRTLEFSQKQQDAIAALGADQVNAAIRKYVKTSALARMVAGDKKKMGK